MAKPASPDAHQPQPMCHASWPIDETVASVDMTALTGTTPNTMNQREKCDNTEVTAKMAR